MSSVVDSQKMASRDRKRFFCPGALNAAATDIGWMDGAGFGTFQIGVVLQARGAAGTISVFQILANARPDGLGTDVVIKTHALTPAPNAVGHTVWLECTDAEIRQRCEALGIEARYISASVRTAEAADRVVVLYTLADPGYAREDLTVNVLP